MASSTRERVEEICESQGWNDTTLLGLYKSFVEDKKLGDEFADFLEQIVKNEEIAGARADCFIYTPEECDDLSTHMMDTDPAGNCFMCGET